MKKFSTGSDDEHVLRDSLDLGFTLPVEIGYRPLPPKGSWEAGYQLSLQALELVKDRPEIWVQRQALAVMVEFVM